MRRAKTTVSRYQVRAVHQRQGKLTKPRVDNNACGAKTLRGRAKADETVRDRLSAVTENSNKENEDNVQRLRVAEVNRQPEEYIDAMEEAGLTVHFNAAVAVTVVVKYVSSAMN